MPDFSITLGNKNYSSWSLRGWLALKLTGAAFDERVIPLRRPETRSEILAVHPSGRVPILHVHGPEGDQDIWDSLAIAEYFAERFPDAGLWPADPTARAQARCVTAEMHAGFKALRTYLPMDLRTRDADTGARMLRMPKVGDDVARIVQIWEDCRERFGEAGGDFLFGHPTIADTAYAPVATRFVTFGVELTGRAARYRDAIMAWPAMEDWTRAALDEPWTIDFPELRESPPD